MSDADSQGKLELPTGSIVGELGPPARTEARYFDPPGNLLPRADAWFWRCGCAAEPRSPGRFDVAPCALHREALVKRFDRKAAAIMRLRPNK